MNLTEFGKRLQLIRESVLRQSQSELAEALNSSQVILSRLERGIGADIKTFFVLLNYFKENGYPVYLMFREQFMVSEFTPSKSLKPTTAKKKVVKRDQIFSEFGAHLRAVREDLLQLPQKDFSDEIRCKTNLYSRLELGLGGNVNVVFNIVSALNKRRLDGAMLFRDPFDISYLKSRTNQAISPEFAIEQLMKLKERFNAEIDNIISQLK